ncbi:ATP-binding cassette domain-containing protein [Parasporobacterium paucivorans]|uniref:ABC-2 type transport system ATP-binding protein n=1 Tax=Parasporobacterium paucivorans DSM 15970 TaxID=1122934 RepID=A0A1M6KPD4_9FIRM|nr:ATP-binding cassette domain-containing protein [Parasporobacterium paucivorans]SHJ60704.1 ABC-2 type transport system ATP-binding protein [Parasporobacterium paucivorans DSM 15970]
MLIEIRNFTKIIKGTNVLSEVSVQFKGGRTYGLEGKNGSGKTMLMRAISGLIRPTMGAVVIDGAVIGKDISFPDSIGLLIENPSFISKYTGWKNLSILAAIQNNISAEDVRDSLYSVGLDPDDKRTYKKYSLGMKHRLGIACAFMENPDIILLDEPFNALDESGVVMVKDLIMKAKNRGAVIIMACHDKDEMTLIADEVYSIRDGKIDSHVVLEKGGTI